MTASVSRRTFFQSVSIGALGLSTVRTALLARPPGGTSAAALSAIAARIALSDLHYIGSAPRSEDGIPLGNGRMGSLVWTVPSGLRLQINRVDVYASNAASDSFNEPHKDYCGGCAFVDIDFTEPIFTSDTFRQHLSVYDGILVIETRDVTARIVPSRDRDAFAIEINDRRPNPEPMRASLRMLRFDPLSTGAQPGSKAVLGESVVHIKEHEAISRLHRKADQIALSQEFREGDYLCRSAVAIGTNAPVEFVEIADETRIALCSRGQAQTDFFIGSAACFDEVDDYVVAQASAEMAAARSSGFARIAKCTKSWWHAFWDQGSIALASADGTAQRLQCGYHYFLYLMASTSGGKYPAKFNGMLWNSGGDPRAWGAQHWYTNTSCYYEALPSAGRFDLMDPLLAMFTAMGPSCERAARDQWGSQGLFIPETVYFDGVAALPEEIASEMRDLYMGRKPWSERSQAFLIYAAPRHPFAAAWNWKAGGDWRNGHYVTRERGQGCYGPVSHIFAATAKIAWFFWQRYEFTLDEAWLRDRAYPMLRGAVEFYRHHPLVAKGPDGRTHIRGSNNSEPVRGARDTNEDLSAMRAVMAALLRASETLGADASLRSEWRTFLDSLAPLPLSDEPDALGADSRVHPAIFAAARGPAVFANPAYLSCDPHSMPAWFFDLCSLHARDNGMKAAAAATLDKLLVAHGPGTSSWNNGLTKLPIAAAQLGLAHLVRDLLPRQMMALSANRDALANTQLQSNRMSLGEGPQALNAQHLGRASQALQLALLQSNPPAPAEAPILSIGPAWPIEWDAEFTLSARGGFAITAALRAGQVTRLSLLSKAGARCQLRNPFAGPVRLVRDGRPAEALAGALLTFGTRTGEQIAIEPLAESAKGHA
jgi:hypothetical protein